MTPVFLPHLILSLLLPLYAATAAVDQTPPRSRERAADHVRAALDAMGGEARWRAMATLRLEGVGHRFLLEQSERFEGPWIPSYEQVNDLWDLRTERLRRDVQRRDYNAPRFAGGTVIVADGTAAFLVRPPDGEPVQRPAGMAMVIEAGRQFLEIPDRVLLRALDAPDLRTEPDTWLHGVQHRVVAFDHSGGTVRVFLNAHDALPSAVETRRAYPDDYFWDVWGDVTLRTSYNFWHLEPGGFHYPRSWNVEWDGKPSRTLYLSHVAFDEDVPDDAFSIAAEVRAAFLAALAGPKDIEIGERWGGGVERRPALELPNGVTLLQGGYNVLLVPQDDGVVVIEAPYSSEYTERIATEVERRFPGLGIKAVVSTGDAWTYVGGVREYVARRVPVYALDLNREVLEKVVTAPHTIDPDQLARAPQSPVFRWVDGRTSIGAGLNRVDLYPIRGRAGERMLMAHLPAHRILWGSDLVMGPRPDGTFFMPQYLDELTAAVRREGLDVGSVVAMHAGPVAWDVVTAAVDLAVAPAQGAPAPAPRAGAAARELAPPTVRVPQGFGYPVLIDGRLDPSEWDDAVAVDVADGVRLLLKQYRGDVFFGVSTGGVSRPVDVYLLQDDRALHQLHASMQIGERRLEGTPWSDQEPPWRWGNHAGWIASEARLDSTKSRDLAFSERLFPLSGVEFQIRRARFSGSRWRVRIEIAQFPGTEGTFVYPPASTRNNTDGWAVFELGRVTS
ncbi:MAG: hypothetical protein Q8L86_15020 [Vicinamibacterales bacterium]|nr:hypothetical protein [Vicinamibacterales bacterium]